MDSQKLFSLSNRVILLTGATGRLGSVIADGLCAAGAKLIICSRTEKDLAVLKSSLVEKGYDNIDTFACDISDVSNCQKIIDYIEKNLGGLDIIVNSAYSGRAGSFDVAEDDFISSYKLNVVSPYYLIQHALHLLKKSGEQHKGGASIINIASMYGMVAPDPSIYKCSNRNSPPFYASAKGGMIQLTRYLACDLAEFNIRVNSISPGSFPNKDIKKQNADFYTKLCEKSPMKRVGTADELVGSIIFLASDASSYVTGINLPVDGGVTAW